MASAGRFALCGPGDWKSLAYAAPGFAAKAKIPGEQVARPSYAFRQQNRVGQKIVRTEQIHFDKTPPDEEKYTLAESLSGR